MTENSGPGGPGPQGPPPLPSRRDFDTTVAHPARVWDYWLGGKDNFAADREAAERVVAAMPSMDATARAGRAFLAAAVHYLAAGMGIRQFLDIGTGLPTANNTHEVAQQVGPDSRIVYVDNDPIVLTHARALLTSDARGATSYIDADLRDTGKILAEARNLLDFSQPVALMLLHILHFIPDTDDPYGIVAKLMEPLASGSYLVLAHATVELTRGRQRPPSGTARTTRPRCRRGPGPRSPGSSTAWSWSSRASPRSGSGAPARWRTSPRQGLATYTAVARKP